jgi:drug/metabolite transporter (DMT)-like permease
MTPEAMRQARTRLILAFGAVYVIWGSTYLAIVFAIQTMPPLLMASARFLIAGGALYCWARFRGAPAPRPVQWGWTTLLGALFFLVGNGTVVWVEQRLPSGLTALIVAMVAVWTALVEWVRPGGSRPSGMVLSGIIMGFLGVAMLVLPGGGHQSGVDLTAVVLLMSSCLCWAFASVFSRKADLPASSPLTSGMEMLTGGVLLFGAGLIAGEGGQVNLEAVTLKSWLSFGYLVVFGSLIGFTCFAWLLKVATPNKVATYGYVNPMVAMFLGWALGGESLSTTSLVASLVIVLSVVLIITGREFSFKAPRMARSTEPLTERDKAVT